MISTQYIKLNMTPSGALPVLYCSRYDIGRPFGLVVHNGSEPVDLDTYTATIEATRTDGTPITAAVTTDDNIGVFVTTAEMTNKEDKYFAKLVLFDSNSRRVASLAFVMLITPATMDENAQPIQEDRSLYQQYTAAVQALIADIREDISDINTHISDMLFNTCLEMQASTTLKSGMIVQTAGYYAVNDGGAALYYVMGSAPVVEYYEILQNGLIAILVSADKSRPEQYGAHGNGTDDDTNAINAALRNADVINFSAKEYAVKNPLFVYGNRTIHGNGANLLVSGASAVMVCGASAMGVEAEHFHGLIEDLNIIVNSGTYDQIIGLWNAKDVVVRRCYIDVSASGVNVTNKLIGGVNNANFAPLNTSRSNIIIENNHTVSHQAWSEDRNNCECCGFAGTKNLVIRDNLFEYSRDDLGAHTCSDVIIENNVLTLFDGRIFSSAPENIRVLNNTLKYISSDTVGMGIAIIKEASTSRRAKNAVISGNLIDYTNALKSASYGIRVGGVLDCVISENILICDDFNDLARIVAEKETIGGTVYSPENIWITENRANGIQATNIDTERIYVCDNVVKNAIQCIVNAVMRGNRFTDFAVYTGASEFYINAYGNPVSGSFTDMGNGGVHGYRFNKKCVFTNLAYAQCNTDPTSGYYRVNAYKNGTLVGYVAFTSSGQITTISSALASAIFDANDVISFKCRAYDVDTISDAIMVSLGFAVIS